MKKRRIACLALVMLLTLTACGDKKTQQEQPTHAPAAELPLAETLPELNSAKAAELGAWDTEGRLPGGEYDLPEKLTSMEDWQQSGGVALLAEQGDVAFYAVEGKEKSVALLRWGDSLAEFDWLYVTPRGIEPTLWLRDVDEDGVDEVVVNCYGGSGTGVSLEFLHIVEKSEDGTLTGCELPWQEVEKAVGEQLQILNLNGSTYAALGRELVDITAAVKEQQVRVEAVSLGAVAAYRPAEEGLTCSFGVVAEGEGIPYLAMYVATVEGDVRYENGFFTLENLHLLSIE